MIKRTLYFGNPAYLSLQRNQLVIKLPEVEHSNDMSEVIKREAVRTIPIEDIGVVVLDNRQITLTQGLLAALAEQTCALITCDARSMPTSLTFPLVGNTLLHEHFEQQITSSIPLRKQLWQQTMRAKINNQAELLERDANVTATCMRKWANDVRSGDPDNLEGRAAAYYWKHLFTPQVQHFVRSRDGEYPNALLNYGYAILRAIVSRALVSSGLHPAIGIHHHNRYNAFCLADDIMEPYRPFIDQLVLRLVRTYPQTQELTHELKAHLLGIPTLDVVIDGKRSPLMVAVTTTTASLVKCFAGEIRKVLYPEFSKPEL